MTRSIRSYRRDRAVVLILAVAVIAILAVVGFSFASSMKLEYAATSVMKHVGQARLAAQAGMHLFLGQLRDDAIIEPGSSAGPLADHSGETMYTVGLSDTLLRWGDLSVTTIRKEVNGLFQTHLVRDESSKLNLNATGNISKWNYVQKLSDSGYGSITTATAQLYHGANANQRTSSFEVSLEEFFYQCYLLGKLWGPGDPYDLSGDANAAKKARVRSANMARAVCLFRYGADGKPGTGGADDDKDNDFGTNGLDDDRNGLVDDAGEAGFGLVWDKIDNDSDGNTDEVNEGFDEPDEYNPYRLFGDDVKFTALSQFKEAIGKSYSVSGNNPPGSTPTTYSVSSIAAAVNYSGTMASADIATEANRVYELLRNELTVNSYALDTRSVSIDDPAWDGYDNDGDGSVDEDDGNADATTGIPATTIADIEKQMNAGKTINQVDINEARITKDAQAAYVYWKLNQLVNYTTAAGTPVTPVPELVKGFSVQNAVDLVDYRDIDCIPTVIAKDALATNVPSEDTYGFEGLHITEVGRYILSGSGIVADNAPWAGTGTCTLTVDATPQADRTSVLTLAGGASLKQGAYLLKMTVTVPATGSITFLSTTGETSDATASGTFFFGPFNVNSSGTGTVTVTASAVAGEHKISAVHVLLPYIEITNMSKTKRDMTALSVKVGTRAPLSIGNGTLVAPAAGGGGESVIVDNADGLPSVTISSGWTVSSSQTDRWAADYLHDGNAGKGLKTARFTPTLESGGMCDVYMMWSQNTNRADNVPWTVTHAGGTATGPVNQKLNGGKWNLIGSWQFNAGSSGNVLIETTGTNGYVVADAVKFEMPLPPKYAPPQKRGAAFDATEWRGLCYGHFLIVYDRTAFENNFGGPSTIDFPICVLPSLFAEGFDGSRNIQLLGGPDRDVLVAGGVVDRFDADNGTFTTAGGSFTSAILARARTSCGGNKSYDAFSTVTTTAGAASCSPGRWKCNSTCISNSHKLWPNLVSLFQNNDDVDAITISDRGWFVSPAEMTKLQVAGKQSTTMSLFVVEDSGWLNFQPDISQLPGWVVAARSPARININTAPEPVLAAAMCNRTSPQPTAADLIAARPYTRWAWLAGSVRRSISSSLKDGSVDHDGDNDGDDASEKLLWAIWFSNVFTLRSSVFTANFTGQIKDSAGTTLATSSTAAMFDRGKRLDSSGSPIVEIRNTSSGEEP